MMKSYLLGIDIGTSACKVAVFDRNGKVLAAASGDYPVYYPHEGWAKNLRFLYLYNRAEKTVL